MQKISEFVRTMFYCHAFKKFLLRLVFDIALRITVQYMICIEKLAAIKFRDIFLYI